MKGTMTTEFTVWCGQEECACWLQVCANNKTGAAKEAKCFGWRRRRKEGWTCPACLLPAGEYGRRYHRSCGQGDGAC